jgi:tRNA threonylcarbamoyladenosine modification (KEOPS) complex Cgi121 subunit
MDFVGITSMNVKNFNISEFNLDYYVGVGRLVINVDNILNEKHLSKESEVLDFIFKLIEQTQEKYKDTVIQFFSDTHIIDQNHVYNACYFMLKAFLNNSNILTKKNLELFLYMATRRQIKIGIDAFGITLNDLNKGSLCYCIVSFKDNILEINNEVLNMLNTKEIELEFNIKTASKLQQILEFFEINEKQINIILKSYGINEMKITEIKNSIENLNIALNDLVCEKMVLLSLEKLKIN